MLIIVESPAKAKTIAKIVGSKHTVKASVGHIRSLSNDSKTKDGRKMEINGVDIDNNFTPLYVIDEAKKKVVTELKKLAKAAEDGILFATDADREGEAISWHLAQVLGIKDITKIQRLEFHEITKKAIDEAMSNPRPLNITLVSAQKARQVLDKMVGYKLSPVIWNVMGNRHLSAGRVQSPALRLVVEREKEIIAFVPEEYWNIIGLFEDSPTNQAKEVFSQVDTNSEDDDNLPQEESELELKPYRIKGKPLPKTIESKDMLLSLVNGLAIRNKFVVTTVITKEEKSSPKPPFTTSTLQQTASSALGYAPRDTMRLAQRLYEGVDIDGSPTALITYMRTDSLSLSQDSLQAAHDIIRSQYSEHSYGSFRFYKNKSKNSQEAHEAIRPTDPMRTPDQLKGKLDQRQWKLYDLIWKRMIASQMADEVRSRVTFELTNDSEDAFKGSVSWTVRPGYKVLFPSLIKAKPPITLSEGQTVYLHELDYSQHFTKPPSRYSQASLIKKLEELGIGRPSTYATIISTLIDREYVENQKSQMKPTALGMKVSDLLTDNFERVTSSDLTAQMEDKLDEISRGEKEYEDVLSEFWWGFKEEVETKSAKITENRDQYRSSETDEKCPLCLGGMDLKIGRFGEYFQCQTHAEHKFQKNYKEYNQALDVARTEYADQTKGQVCKECGKDLIVRVSKSSLKPYIACPEYKVGNNHTVESISFGPCPKCAEDGRKGKKAGKLVQRRGFRGKGFIGCSLDKKVCGYIQPNS